MKEIRTLTAIETSNIVPMRKYDKICNTIVAISDIARALNAAQETMQSQLAVIENDTSLQLSYWRLQILAYGVSAWANP